MNILDFEGFKVESLDELISKQKEVMIAFEPDLEKRIEEFDIDIYEDQMLLKDFLLVRAVEELTEAGAAMAANHVEHYKEEIIDVFNFLVEAAILLNYPITHASDIALIDAYFEGRVNSVEKSTYKLCHEYSDEENRSNRLDWIQRHLYHLVQCIGELTNVLKLRPWRQSQYPVDLLTFRKRWDSIWDNFWLTLYMEGFSFEELLTVWSKKYQVNKFRIDSNY